MIRRPQRKRHPARGSRLPRRAVAAVISAALLLASAASAHGLTAMLSFEERMTLYPGRDSDTGVVDGSLAADVRDEPLAPGVRFTLAGVLRYSSAGTARFDSWNEPSGRDTYQPALGLRELSFELTPATWLAPLRAVPGSLRLRLGKLAPQWGASDRVRPTDVVTPWDYTDLTRPERFGEWGTSVRWSDKRNRHQLEGVWLPVFSPNRFAADGPWQLIPEGVDTTSEWPDDDDVHGNQQFGLRACRRGRASLCAMTYFGRDRLARVRPTSPTSATLLYPRLRVYGADAQVDLAGVMLRLEVAYRDSEDGFDDYAEAVFAAERIWFDLDRHGSSLFALVQYSQQLPKRDDPFWVHSVFASGLLSRFRYGKDDGWYGQLETGANFDPNGYLVELTLSGPIYGELRFALAGAVIDGEREHLFGARFADNDRLLFSLLWNGSWPS